MWSRQRRRRRKRRGQQRWSRYPGAKAGGVRGRSALRCLNRENRNRRTDSMTCRRPRRHCQRRPQEWMPTRRRRRHGPQCSPCSPAPPLTTSTRWTILPSCRRPARSHPTPTTRGRSAMSWRPTRRESSGGSPCLRIETTQRPAAGRPIGSRRGEGRRQPRPCGGAIRVWCGGGRGRQKRRLRGGLRRLAHAAAGTPRRSTRLRDARARYAQTVLSLINMTLRVVFCLAVETCRASVLGLVW